jgi:hypothetical protein
LSKADDVAEEMGQNLGISPILLGFMPPKTPQRKSLLLISDTDGCSGSPHRGSPPFQRILPVMAVVKLRSVTAMNRHVQTIVGEPIHAIKIGGLL